MSTQAELTRDDHNIATAPGDLPLPEVQARLASLRTQFRHDNTIVPLAPAPGEPVEIWATAGIEVPVRSAAVFYSTDGSPPGLSSAQVPMEIASVDWAPRTGYVRRFRGVLPGQPVGTTVRYRIGGWRSPQEGLDILPDRWAHDGQGLWFRQPGEDGITTFAFPVEATGPPMPIWMRDAVIYHIFVDRFHPGNKDGSFPHGLAPRTQHGGTLAGIRKSLPYLTNLGFTCIWLSPIHPAKTYHRYDGEDFFAVDPVLGTEDEFRELIEDVHTLGMRIWMDFVPSHCSWKHPAFLAAQRDRNAETYNWFTFMHWPDTYRNFAQTSKYLPSFNLEDPGARAYVIESAVYWLRDFSVDGFRLDHAIAPSMDFWTAFMAATEEAQPEVVNVGEATDTPDSLRRFRGRLHGILDFELARVLRLAFGRGEWSVSMLDAWLCSYQIYMADAPGRVSFLDNHDMDRFLWVAGNRVERLKLAALFQFTLSPTPVVYYGTEIGLTQRVGSEEGGFGGDENARGDMIWDRGLWDEDLLAFYRTLTRVRRDYRVLAEGGFRTVHVDDEQKTYAYARVASEGAPKGDILVMLNLGDDEAHVELPRGLAGVSGQCLVSTGSVQIRDSVVTVAAWSGAVFLLA